VGSFDICWKLSACNIFLVGNLAAYYGNKYEADPSEQHNSVITIDPCGHRQDAVPYFTKDFIVGRNALV
jgi:hypothetical protein